MNSYNPSGKIQRVAAGNLRHPGCCFSCGSAARSVYALIGFTEWDGAIYLCEICVLSSMTVFESLMIPADEKALRDEISKLELKNARLANRVVDLEKTNESYKSVFAHTGISPVRSNGSTGNASPSHNPNDRVHVSEVVGLPDDVDGPNDSTGGPGPRDSSELVATAARKSVQSVAAAIESDGDSGQSTSGEGRNSGSGSGRSRRAGEEFGGI